MGKKRGGVELLTFRAEIGGISSRECDTQVLNSIDIANSIRRPHSTSGVVGIVVVVVPEQLDLRLFGKSFGWAAPDLSGHKAEGKMTAKAEEC